MTDITTNIPAPAGLAELGWDPGWATAFLPYDAAGLRPARVVAAHRDAWVVARPGEPHDADAIVTGRLRHEALGPGDLPAVGDWVAAAPTDGAGSPVVIQAVVARRTAFTRSSGEERRAGRLVAEQVLAANVDVAFVVAGMDGDFNLRRLERYLAVAWSGGATPVIVLNKADVAGDVDGLRVAAEAIAPGVDVRAVSARRGDGIEELRRDHLAVGRTGVVIGSSGVGKSTLVNALLGEERQATGAVRGDDSRGRHTTTHRELLRMPGGALLIDTPGIRSLGIAGAADGLEPAFADIADLALQCRFSDCRHAGEPGCAVAAALTDGRLAPDRLESHRKLEREAAHVARTTDPLLRAEERRKWKAIHSSVNQHMKRKYGSDR
ncbi:MAG TPA: ribosome small subunit-dependent GTPase A [Candidatus Limnocylindrales bacterium]|nr:ribosome small subunit-dependent GTPase A [Candidatus Limnocylindrales bacterium]